MCVIYVGLSVHAIMNIEYNTCLAYRDTVIAIL